MVQVNEITNGIVIDHVRAGFGMKVLEYLNIDTSKNSCGSVALLMNVKSKKYGKKDLIKLENVKNIDVNVLGLIDHNATVIYIKDEKIVSKINLELPKTVTNVLECKNPRCITSSESIPHIFTLTDETGKYRCDYCDNIINSYDSFTNFRERRQSK